MINTKPLIKFLLWTFTLSLVFIVGISNVFADTNINMSTWTNVTGRKWSSNNYESSSNIIIDTDTIRAYYNVSSPIYTPPNSYDYVDFLYFQHNGNFNPCDGDDFKTNFYLKFSVPSFVNYVSRVRFSYHSDTGLDSCIISSRNSTTGRVDVSCSTHYESNSNSLIIWVDFNRNIPDTQNSWLYIQKNFSLSCMTNSQAIINNQNQNTQNIINNNNQNSQNIINNNNENTQKIIDENKKNFNDCTDYNFNNDNISLEDGFLRDDGTISLSSAWQHSDYIPIEKNKHYTFTKNYNGGSASYCYYNSDKTLINCTAMGFTNNFDLSLNQNGYVRLSLNKTFGNISFTGSYCSNKLDETKDAINNLDDTLKDGDTSGAESKASEFFSSFNTDTFGLTSIITAPLNLIRSVLSSSCTDLQLPLPYLDNKKLILPCMTSIYSQYFGTFFTIYQTITYGIIAYWVCVRIFNQVKDFKNPEHDEIEVMDL